MPDVLSGLEFNLTSNFDIDFFGIWYEGSKVILGLDPPYQNSIWYFEFPLSFFFPKIVPSCMAFTGLRKCGLIPVTNT